MPSLKSCPMWIFIERSCGDSLGLHNLAWKFQVPDLPSCYIDSKVLCCGDCYCSALIYICLLMESQLACSLSFTSSLNLASQHEVLVISLVTVACVFSLFLCQAIAMPWFHPWALVWRISAWVIGLVHLILRMTLNSWGFLCQMLQLLG